MPAGLRRPSAVVKHRMRISLGAALLLFSLAGTEKLLRPARAQEKEGEPQVRGLFLETRPAKAARPAAKSAPPAAGQRLAFGYTLFLDGAGGPKRVSADRVFHSGERLRLLVETNADAYLYVFHQEGPGQPTMIFPDARIAGGENRVTAHQPLDVPEGDWFVFDEHAGEERLTLLLADKPLPDVPRGPALDRKNEFKVTADALQKLILRSQPSATESSADEGAPMRPAEGQRGLKLSTDDPPPSRLVMKKSAAGGWVVAQVRLSHR